MTRHLNIRMRLFIAIQFLCCFPFVMVAYPNHSITLNDQIVSFHHETIDNIPHASSHYVLSVDINNDGYPDLVNVGFHGPTVWYQNPNIQAGNHQRYWTKRVISSGDKHVGGIHVDFIDVNGDGYLDAILAHKWGNCFMNCSSTDGAVAWLENPGSIYDNEWKEHIIVETFGTGVHRVLGKVVGGQVFVVVSSMVGAGSSQIDCFQDKDAKQVVYRLDRESNSWSPLHTVTGFHLVHEIYHSSLSNRNDPMVVMTSSEGVHRMNVLTGEVKPVIDSSMYPAIPESYERCGWVSSFVDSTSFFPSMMTGTSTLQASSFKATIEPLHGNTIVLYTNATRQVVDTLSFQDVVGSKRNHVSEHGIHDIKLLDIDCDGNVDILVAARGSESISKGLYLYRAKSPNSSMIPTMPTFHKRTRLSGQSVNGIAIDDFDKDGVMDFAVVGWGTNRNDHGIVVFYNRNRRCLLRVQ